MTTTEEDSHSVIAVKASDSRACTSLSVGASLPLLYGESRESIAGSELSKCKHYINSLKAKDMGKYFCVNYTSL